MRFFEFVPALDEKHFFPHPAYILLTNGDKHYSLTGRKRGGILRKYKRLFFKEHGDTGESRIAWLDNVADFKHACMKLEKANKKARKELERKALAAS